MSIACELRSASHVLMPTMQQPITGLSLMEAEFIGLCRDSSNTRVTTSVELTRSSIISVQYFYLLVFSYQTAKISPSKAEDMTAEPSPQSKWH